MLASAVLHPFKKLRCPVVRTANEKHTGLYVSVFRCVFKICPSAVVFEGVGILISTGGKPLESLGGLWVDWGIVDWGIVDWGIKEGIKLE